MRVGVVGGRHRNDVQNVFKILERFIKPGDIIVTGGAIGVDSMAEVYAKEKNIPVRVFYPRHPICREAFLERNTEIAHDCDILLAFPSKLSRGTWDTINKARGFQKRVMIFEQGGG